MFCVVWDYSCSKRKGKKCKQNTLLKSYKNEIEILANPGLAWSGFEQPGPVTHARPNSSSEIRTHFHSESRTYSPQFPTKERKPSASCQVLTALELIFPLSWNLRPKVCASQVCQTFNEWRRIMQRFTPPARDPMMLSELTKRALNG